jgi:sugar/nucleoside kinase (ribokinase family)
VDFLFGCSTEEGADKLLNEFGVSLAMVTLGPNGAYLKNKNGSTYVKCPKVNPIDTTGAGDIFGGSAVSRLLKIGVHPAELSVDQMYAVGSFASTAASLSTEHSGGIPSIPAEETVLANVCK